MVRPDVLGSRLCARSIPHPFLTRFRYVSVTPKHKCTSWAVSFSRPPLSSLLSPTAKPVFSRLCFTRTDFKRFQVLPEEQRGHTS
jgi:hypothetical protein